jgi:hypothetical protein
MPRPRVEKSPDKSPRLRGVAANPALRGPGRGPAKGAPNAGRPPDEFRAHMRALVSRADVTEALTEVLSDKRHPHFAKAFQMAAEFGYGKAAQSVELSGAGGLPMAFEVVHRIVDPADGDSPAD